MPYAGGEAAGAVWHTLVMRDIAAHPSDHEALERSNHDLQQFAGVASHDLKTPLRSISGFIQRLNLVGNSLKYCKDRALVICIFASRQANKGEICVDVNDIGIEQKHDQQIFEVFKRLHGQHDHPGTDIGLAVCGRGVSHHGDTIWVTSVLGQGSTFHVTIPAIL